jgi:hypothetical protein
MNQKVIRLDEMGPLAGLAVKGVLAAGTALAGKAVYDKAKGVAGKMQQRNQQTQQAIDSLKNSFEPEGEMVDEARAIGRTRSTDANPRGAAVRVSSGRGSTMTPARGLGASKPKGDDEERSNRQKEQAKKDRRAAARDRAEEGEDRLSRLVRSVQNSSYEPEGEVLEDYVVVNKDGSRKIVKGDPPTPKVKPSPYNRALAKKQKKEASRNRDENPYRARPGESD